MTRIEVSPMKRCLVVANQTLGGRALEAEIRHRIEGGSTEFTILVPLSPPANRNETRPRPETVWGLPASVGPSPEAVDEARTLSERRLDWMVEWIRSLGGVADGVVGDTDPVQGVRDLLDEEAYDEIIVSTLPAGVSRWLKMDVPQRISRMVDVPVTTVEADES
jgi:hypothetical protein